MIRCTCLQVAYNSITYGIRAKRIENAVCDSGDTCSTYSVSVDLVFFKVILGTLSALVSNLILSNICAKFTSVIRTPDVKQSAKVNGPLFRV